MCDYNSCRIHATWHSFKGSFFQISILADAMDRFNGRNRGNSGGGGGTAHGDVFRRVSRMSRRSFR